MKQRIKHEYWLDHSPIDKAFLSLFKSPSDEVSTFKGIPIDKLNLVRSLLPMKNRRIVFRGTSKPGYRRPQAYTIKSMADTFAVYFDNDYELHLGRP